MHRRSRTMFLTILITLCSFSLLLCGKVADSQAVQSYHPTDYAPANATRYVSGSLGDLGVNDGAYMTFQSSPSQVSPRSLYAHQETITVAGTNYYVSSINASDMTGTDLYVPLSSTGRIQLGRFIYPLTGVTSIPSSAWTVYYRAWLSNLADEVSVNSPSWIPHAWWGNAEHAYSSDDLYANSSLPVMQEYGGYGFDLPPTAIIKKIEVGYEAYALGDEVIRIALSVDGGTGWIGEFVTPSLGTTDRDITRWIDFTTAANWTISMLSNSVFRSGVTIVKMGALMDDVLLDWLPVRVTFVGSAPLARADVNVCVRRSDGAIRQTLAVNVADSESLSVTAKTLSGVYDWPGYSVFDETDYLEIDYYVDILVAAPVAVANLRIDDVALIVANQTRVADIMLPSEYVVDVEFSGHSNTNDWTRVIWIVDVCWTTGNVFATLQLYDYLRGAYPTTGDGYVAFSSSSFPNSDETKTQTITANTSSFRDYSGSWKMRIMGTKSAASPFGLKLDLSTYEVTPAAYRDVAVLGIAYTPTIIYSRNIVAVNVTVKNEGEASESFGVTAYYDSNQIGRQTVANLMPNESTSLTFNWNTTGTTPGAYTLRAVADTVMNESETTDNIFVYGSITIKAQPRASFSRNPSSPVVNETVTFNASSSTSDGSYISDYEWDFGDGNATTTGFVTITHRYPNVGSYTVTLNVTNSDGIWDIDSQTIGVSSGTSDGSFSPAWNWTWALLSIPLMVLVFAGIGWKKRKPKPKYVGIEYLNKITDGGIPDSFSVMLVGGSDSGKNSLFQELALVFLKMEKPCVYVAYECFPDEIRENFRRNQPNTPTLESQGKLSFIDCFSSTARVQSREKHFLNQPYSLVDLGIAISRATNEARARAGDGVKVFLDSIVPLLTQLDPARVVDFLQDRMARVKGVKGNLFFTSSKESMDSALMSQLEEFVDCIIELDASQVKGKIVRKLRIKKMRGRNSSDKWVQFEIVPEKGVVFST